ncbi:glycosyltransferase family 4 protein [Candidatus Woesearchaeota archaeon]|nr:glycosyltransferase family 4 protein [Candidatus Woesearchaeota archaeon]
MKTCLVLASTFPRWKNDTTPSFIYELSKRLMSKDRAMVVLAPHAGNAKKHEFFDKLDVYRFQYFFPSSIQKVAYGAGIISNVKSSLFTMLQVPFFLLSEYIKTAILIRKYNPEVIHAHWLIPQGIIASMLKGDKKLIVTIHGSDLFPLKNPFFKSLQRNVLKSCDICTVNSEATKNELIKRFPEYKNKAIIIPMGVDTQLFKKNDKLKISKYKNNKIILFAGRLNEQKGAEYLIKAMAIVNKRIKNAKLLVIGEGEHKKELQKIAYSLNIDNIEFLGPINQRGLADYYNTADVFVLPSVTSRIGTESQGLVLLEAMSCGTPVIGTNTGGIPSIVKNNQTGILVNERNENELSNAITKIMSDRKLLQKLSTNGIKFVKNNYSWDIVAKKFDDLYKKMEK